MHKIKLVRLYGSFNFLRVAAKISWYETGNRSLTPTFAGPGKRIRGSQAISNQLNSRKGQFKLACRCARISWMAVSMHTRTSLLCFRTHTDARSHYIFRGSQCTTVSVTWCRLLAPTSLSILLPPHPPSCRFYLHPLRPRFSSLCFPPFHPCNQI